MGVIYEPGYVLPSGDEPLTHARIAHAGTWIDGTVTAVGDTEGAPAANRSMTWEFWSPPGPTPNTWTITPASGQTVDYCCIGAHTIGTDGATLTIEYESAPAVWTSIITNAVISDDSPIFAIFAPVTGTAFRITVSTTVARIGVIRFGTALQMPQALYAGHTPLQLSRQTTMRSNKSTTGEFLGRTRLRNARATQIGWTHLRASWVRQNWLPFELAVEQDPFFLAWRPETFPEDVGYCYVDAGATPVPSNMGIRDFMSVSMNVIARGYD